MKHEPPPQPDVTALQRVIGALQAQRNQALDACASAEAHIQELRARIAELEKQDEP